MKKRGRLSIICSCCGHTWTLRANKKLKQKEIECWALEVIIEHFNILREKKEL